MRLSGKVRSCVALMVVTVCMAWSAVQPATAATVEDQSNPIRLFSGVPALYGGSSDTFGFRRLQSFTVGTTGTLSSIEIGTRVSNVGTLVAPNLSFVSRLDILGWSGDANAFGATGTVLVNDAITSGFEVVRSFISGSTTPFTNFDGWLKFDVSSLGINVVAGQVLGLELVAGQGFGGTSYLLGDTYDQGRLFVKPQAATDFTAETFDAPFRSFVTAEPIPEPETYVLMLAGLGLLGLVARRRRAGAAG